MQYLYIVVFLLGIPFIWNVLLSLRFESIFQQGKIWQIRLAYVLVSIILSHFLADAIYTFASNINALF